MSDKPRNLSDIDSFWDLNSLLPKKRPVAPSNRAVNTDTVELDIGSDRDTRDSGTPIPPRDSERNENGTAQHYRVTDRDHITPHEAARRLNEIPMRSRAEEYRSRPLDPYLIYEPTSRLIKRVEVAKWDSKFNFYENFRTDAKRLWSRAAAQCEHVSFFSYVPQYSQLKYSQLKWYLWWRENIRHGIYLRTDFCYILLYIYEIINCPDLVCPTQGLELLCNIWLNYREEHRRIDSYLCEWLCDFCLINQLPCPTDRLEPILGEIVAAASLKEFYMDCGIGSVAASVLEHTSAYDWRKSRYVTNENVSLFAKHIRGAFDKVWHDILSDANNESGTLKEFRYERSAYEGALCVYDMKRTVTVEYVSYSRSPKFRFVVTDIIKYSENRIRMALGIKSRLKVEELSDGVKACIDEYFDANLPAPRKARSVRGGTPAAEVNEYDKLYEPVSSEFSLENAIRIEQSSWSTTEILTNAFEDEPSADSDSINEFVPAKVPLTDVSKTIQSSDTADEFEAFAAALDDVSREALKLLAAGDPSGISKLAAASAMLADALADRINETAYDLIGDSVIEADGDGYKLISDYEGDIIKWLK